MWWTVAGDGASRRRNGGPSWRDTRAGASARRPSGTGPRGAGMAFGSRPSRWVVCHAPAPRAPAPVVRRRALPATAHARRPVGHSDLLRWRGLTNAAADGATGHQVVRRPAWYHLRAPAARRLYSAAELR